MSVLSPSLHLKSTTNHHSWVDVRHVVDCMHKCVCARPTFHYMHVLFESSCMCHNDTATYLWQFMSRCSVCGPSYKQVPHTSRFSPRCHLTSTTSRVFVDLVILDAVSPSHIMHEFTWYSSVSPVSLLTRCRLIPCMQHSGSNSSYNFGHLPLCMVTKTFNHEEFTSYLTSMDETFWLHTSVPRPYKCPRALACNHFIDLFAFYGTNKPLIKAFLLFSFC